MHKLKIIHKDVKILNILYSYAHKKFVLSDFGISHSVK
jgi:serine/threonine protein kinase